MKTVVITGASKGIGRELALKFSKEGYRVVSLSRTVPEEKCDNIENILFDVTDYSALPEMLEKIYKKYKSIDILINNAGFGISGSVEYTEINDAQHITNVNFLGVFYVTKYALKYLRESRGIIVNLSSVAGDLHIPYQTFYSATKSAVIAFSNGLRNELKPFGVKVLCVLPGDAKTSFTSARIKQKDEREYSSFAEKSVKIMEIDEQNGMSAEYVANKIFKYTTKKRLPQQKVVGNKYKFLYVISKLLPKKFVNYIIFKMYGGK